LLSRQSARQGFASEFIAESRLILKIGGRHFTCDLTPNLIVCQIQKTMRSGYTNEGEATNVEDHSKLDRTRRAGRMHVRRRNPEAASPIFVFP